MVETIEVPPVSFEAFKLIATGTFWFEARGNRVVFRNGFRLFGDDGEDPPEETLVVAQQIGGNYGTVVDASDVAQLIADLLNQNLSPLKVAEAQRK